MLNYFAGLRFIEKNLKKSRLTHEDMLKLHKVIAAGVMAQGTAGRYRTIRVRVGRVVLPRHRVGALSIVVFAERLSGIDTFHHGRSEP